MADVGRGFNIPPAYSRRMREYGKLRLLGKARPGVARRKLPTRRDVPRATQAGRCRCAHRRTGVHTGHASAHVPGAAADNFAGTGGRTENRPPVRAAFA